mgnify:CR=1 FL=1
MKSKIYHKLNIFFSPSFLEIKNESHQHAEHDQSPKNGNSHFFVKIKSKKLSALSRLEGQRLIFKILDDEIKNSIHALRIKILY